MTIRRLDAFFRTQITLDQPRFFNSITNLALAPLQRLVGQNQFHSLKDRISYVPQKTPAVPPDYVTTFFKVVVFVCNFFVAIVLTPIGIAARHMSFRSPEIDRAYSLSYLSQLTSESTPEEIEPAFVFIQKLPKQERNKFLKALPEDLFLALLSLPTHVDFTDAFLSQYSRDDRTELLKKLPFSVQGAYLSVETNAEFAKGYISESGYTQLCPYLSLKLNEFYQAQKPEKEKKQALDKYLTTAIHSLEKLEIGVKAKNSTRLSQLRNDPMYPFPFYFAKLVENDSKIANRADKALWERFLSLKQSCFTFLSPDCDDVLLQTTQAEASKTLTATFKPNVAFFNTLKKLLESEMEISAIKNWIEGQRRAVNYSYPFYTHPSALKLMIQAAKQPEKLQPISDAHSTCLNLLRKKGLEEYINEKPDRNHDAVNALMQAMDQLENISKLQNLITNQTA